MDKEQLRLVLDLKDPPILQPAYIKKVEPCSGVTSPKKAQREQRNADKENRIVEDSGSNLSSGTVKSGRRYQLTGDNHFGILNDV